ncbi:hypothetical protein SDC9_130881 [bioreactor metagenome]|uniref:Uncharacterized protein n=1 Tax=bioreactor metagenome TaxID=1076179 RepID=A0A645D5A9_9ZZZZ
MALGSSYELHPLVKVGFVHHLGNDKVLSLLCFIEDGFQQGEVDFPEEGPFASSHSLHQRMHTHGTAEAKVFSAERPIAAEVVGEVVGCLLELDGWKG